MYTFTLHVDSAHNSDPFQIIRQTFNYVGVQQMPVLSIQIFGCLNEQIPNYLLTLNMVEKFNKVC